VGLKNWLLYPLFVMHVSILLYSVLMCLMKFSTNLVR
jgi:hypothetical protein